MVTYNKKKNPDLQCQNYVRKLQFHPIPYLIIDVEHNKVISTNHGKVFFLIYSSILKLSTLGNNHKFVESN